MTFLERALLVARLRHRFQTWDRERLEHHQTVRVRFLLDQVREKSPFYARLPKGEIGLDAVPVIDKSVMMENFDIINTAGLNGDALVAFKIRQEREGHLDLFDGGYSVGLSSGTTGSRGLTVLSKAERESYGCLIWARSGLPRGIWPIRLLFTLRTNNAAFMQPKSPGTQTTFADYTQPPERLIELINARRINVLAGPPSLLRMIAQRKDTLDRPFRAVVSYAEVLDDATAQMLRQAFRAPLVQLYQCSEGFIATTCKAGNLHLNEDIILVQDEGVGHPDAQVRNVILTDLYRITQPIIRYRLNDLLEFDPAPCPCGSCFRRIRVIHGRADDIFHLSGPDGETRYLFPDYVRRSINQASGDILEYQAIQHSIDDIEIRLVLKSGANRVEIERAVAENLAWRSDAVGGLLGQVRFSDLAPERNPTSGKLIRVVRRF